MRAVLTRRWPASLTLASALLVVASCRGPSEANVSPGGQQGPPGSLADATIPEGQPDIRGTITLVQPGLDERPTGSTGTPNSPVSCPPDCGTGTRLQAVLIEEHPGQPGTGDKSRITVLKEARLLRRTSAGVSAMQFADLRPGQRAEAWFSGPVAESYPTQATARVIVVDER